MSRYYSNEKITLVTDQAGWHKSKNLILPPNITVLYLPPYCPELNPVERLWLYVKANTIRNRIYDSIEALEGKICEYY